MFGIFSEKWHHVILLAAASVKYTKQKTNLHLGYLLYLRKNITPGLVVPHEHAYNGDTCLV